MDDTTRPSDSTAVSPKLPPIEFGLDLLQLIPIVAAIVLSFLGRGRHRHWLLLALAIPLLRMLLSPLFRARVRGLIRRCWQDLEAYALRGGSTPWRAVFCLIVAPAAIFYLGSGGVPGVANGDTSPAVPTAVRFVTHGDFRLDTYVGDAGSSLAIHSRADLPYYVRETPSGLYSNYPAGMTTFAVPIVAVSQSIGADWHRPAVPCRLEKWTGAWLAAATLGIFCLVCLRLARPVPATVCTVLVGIASSVFSTASQDLSQQGGVIFWVLLLIWMEVRSGGQPSRAETMVQAVACGCALTCRVSAALLVGSFLIWVLVRSPRRAVMTGVLAALAFAPWAWFYWNVYHSLLGPSEGQTGAYAWAAIPGRHIWGVMVSPGRGFLVYHPWLLVLLLWPWIPKTERSQNLRGWTVFLVAACLLHTMLIASWGMWWGGHSWGPRLMTEVVPFAALLALHPLGWLWEHRAGRQAIIVLGLVGAWMHIAGPYLNGVAWNGKPLDVDLHPERLWDWRDAPFFFVFHR